jgi:acyl-CoA reductase-like NAD-dependent aldehyde dehydrogenase
MFINFQVVQSISPATGEVIAEVSQGNVDDYDTCVLWRPERPNRGEIVRQMGVAMREKLEPLGKLVSMETGYYRLSLNPCLKNINFLFYYFLGKISPKVLIKSKSMSTIRTTP